MPRILPSTTTHRNGLGTSTGFNLIGFAVDSWRGLVARAFAHMHLDCPCPDCDPEHLVAETDPEGRNVPFDDVLDDGHSIFAGGGRIAARAVGQEHAVWLESRP